MVLRIKRVLSLFHKMYIGEGAEELLKLGSSRWHRMLRQVNIEARGITFSRRVEWTQAGVAQTLLDLEAVLAVWVGVLVLGGKSRAMSSSFTVLPLARNRKYLTMGPG